LRTGVSYSSKDGQYHLRISEDSTFEVHSFIPPKYYRYCEGVLYRSTSQKFKLQYATFNTKNLEHKVEETRLNIAADSVMVCLKTNLWPNELKYFSCRIIINGKEYNYDLQKDHSLFCCLKIDSIQVALKYDDSFTSFTAKYKDFATSTYIPKSTELNSLSFYIPFKREYAYYEIPRDSQVRIIRRSIKLGNTKLFETE
jgi:hypothetical protein